MKYLGIEPHRPRVAVFDFTGCEGCELQLANKEETLGAFLDAVEVVSFREVSSAHGDDYEILWIDLDQDGVFDGNHNGSAMDAKNMEGPFRPDPAHTRPAPPPGARVRAGVGLARAADVRPVCGFGDRPVLDVQGPARPRDVRRSLQAGCRLSRDLAVAAPTSRP